MDGYIWGRGALDMKSGVAMMLAAFLKARADKIPLPGDVLFAAVADEEAGDDFGVNYLVNEHADLFKGVKYAFGEFGGFNLSISGKRFYPIMIAEKQTCWMKATFTGPAGHGSMPIHGGAMAKLSRALHLLDTHHLPVHVTPSVRMMVESLARNLGGAPGLVIRQLLNPALTDSILKILGEQGALFSPLLHNTVSPTMLKASEKANVIPAEVSLGMDGRLVPGAKPENMIRELHALLGEDIQFEVFKAEPGPAAPDMGLFDTLGGILQEQDPDGIPLPYVLTGVTDARFLSKLGIQTYGFTPLQLPDGFNFASTIHAADERVPVAALDFGVKVVGHTHLHGAPLEPLTPLDVHIALLLAILGIAFGEHRGEGDGHHVGRRRDRNLDIGRHARADALVNVLQQDARGESLDVVLDRGLRGDSFDGAGDFEAGNGLHRDLDLLAGREPRHVRLVDVGNDDHRREVGNRQHLGAAVESA